MAIEHTINSSLHTTSYDEFSPVLDKFTIGTLDRVEYQGKTFSGGTLRSRWPHFSDIFADAFECNIPSEHKSQLAAQLFLLVEEHNTAYPQSSLHPIGIRSEIKTTGQIFREFLIPPDERGKTAELLKLNANRFEESLPFRVTQEEMLLLHQNDEQTISTIIERLASLGARLAKNHGIPQAPAQEVAITVAQKFKEGSDLWRLLLNSTPPVKNYNINAFYRVFATSIYRKAVNYHRDLERRKRRSEPFSQLPEELITFLTAHPIDSPHYEGLMRRLTIEERQIFLLRAYFSAEYHEIAELLNNGKNASNMAQLITDISQIVRKPIENWPAIPTKRILIDYLMMFPQNIIDEICMDLTEREKQCLELRNQGLTNQEIGAMLDASEKAIKALWFRASEKIFSAATSEGLINTDGSIELPQFPD